MSMCKLNCSKELLSLLGAVSVRAGGELSGVPTLLLHLLASPTGSGTMSVYSETTYGLLSVGAPLGVTSRWEHEGHMTFPASPGISFESSVIQYSELKMISSVPAGIS